MAGVKISDLDLVVQINDSDFIPLARGAETKKIEGKRFASSTALNSLSSVVLNQSNNTTVFLGGLSAQIDNAFSQISSLSTTTISQIVSLSSTLMQTISSGNATVEVSTTAPAAPTEGDLWYNPTDNSLYVYYLSQWVQVGGAGGTLEPTDPVISNSFLVQAPQTNFQLQGLLSLTDYSTNTAAYRVVISGIIQSPETAYTVTNNIITLSSPAQPGDRVVVTFKKNSPTFDPFLNSFTGTGSQQTFGLTGFTPHSNAALYRVTVNGVIQEPGDDYTIVGSDIIFQVAPAAGDDIIVVSKDVFPTESAVKTVHIADGNTSAFFIAGVIPSTNSSSYRIDINGAVQEPGYSFAVDGSLIRFASSPNAGDKITIVTSSEPVIIGTGGTIGGLVEESVLVSNSFISEGTTESELYGLNALTDYSTNAAAYRVVVDGATQEPVESYTVSGRTLTFTAPVPAGSRVAVTFKPDTAEFNPYKEIFIGTGTQQLFAFASTFTSSSTTCRVTLDGVVQEADTDYTVSTGGITFVAAPAAGTRIVVISEDVFLSSTTAKYKFIVSGTTSTFEISDANCSSNSSAYRIDINGVTQEAGVDYGIYGQTIAFTSVLPIGAKVVIVTSVQAAKAVPQTLINGAVYLNDQRIAKNTTIPTGKNGMSAGPITINDGIELTVSRGSTYTVVL
jgi:hypothetical protein